ncbi:sacsin-like [Planoprotostelium fungivorum]|uniref:Sacsin-like n=1 Tax=Planoprotostelium fungivorum TaxID=1890364 RepID=A0A2P6N4U8_9EUKA|nr:sacsin-like [Planoprotostelium fungivorum]
MEFRKILFYGIFGCPCQQLDLELLSFSPELLAASIHNIHDRLWRYNTTRIINLQAMTITLGRGEGERFEQVKPLWTIIKETLEHRYLDGSQYREVTQNADDANATEVKIILDEQQHDAGGIPHLLNPMLAPSLCVYNDAPFSGEDWKNVLAMSNSMKKADLSVTGEFGMGFNSLYHATDTIIICSGLYVAILTPCEEIHGWRFTLDQVPAHMKSLLSKMTPIEEGKGFKGTLIRLPLRSKPSHLKDVITEPSDILSQLTKMRDEASLLLVFLGNVKKITVGRTTSGGDEESIFTAQASTEREDGTRIRSQIKGIEGNWTKASPEDHTKITTITVNTPSGESVVTKWFIRGCLPGGELADIAEKNKKKYKLVPYLQFAVAVDGHIPEGRAFTGLPLPFTTGMLGIHLNAHFQLKEDRAHLFVKSEFTGDDKRAIFRADWNEKVIHASIAYIVSNLRRLVDSVIIKPEALYRLFPIKKMNEPWSIVMDTFYQGIQEQPIFWNPLRGEYLSIDQGVFPGDAPQLIVDVLRRMGCTVFDISPIERIDEHIRRVCGERSRCKMISPSYVRSALIQPPNNSSITDEERLQLLMNVIGQWRTFNQQKQSVILSQEEKSLFACSHQYMMHEEMNEAMKKYPKLFNHYGIHKMTLDDLSRFIKSQTQQGVDASWASRVWTVIRNHLSQDESSDIKMYFFDIPIVSVRSQEKHLYRYDEDLRDISAALECLGAFFHDKHLDWISTDVLPHLTPAGALALLHAGGESAVQGLDASMILDYLHQMMRNLPLYSTNGRKGIRIEADHFIAPSSIHLQHPSAITTSHPLVLRICKTLKDEEFLLRCMMDASDEEEYDTVMSDVLARLPSVRDRSHLIEKIMIRALFICGNPLRSLLLPSERVNANFTANEYSSSMRILHVKNSPTGQDIVRLANRISQEKDPAKSKSLLEILGSVITTTESVAGELENIPFVCSIGQRFVSPAESYAKKWIGLVNRDVEIAEMDPKLHEILGCPQQPSVDMIYARIVEISQSDGIETEASMIPLYKHISDRLKEEEWVTYLKDKEWLWIGGNRFIRADEVAVKNELIRTIDVLPALPPFLTRMKDIIGAFDIKASYSCEEYEGLLRRWKDEDVPSHREAIVSIIEYLSGAEGYQMGDDVPLLTHNDKMVEKKKIYYIDNEHLAERVTQYELLNSSVSNHAATKLNLSPISSKYQEENSDSFGEEFGQQQEPLHERLKNLIRDYPSNQLLKEMLQNTDDAGASEMTVLFDERQHPRDSLFNVKMETTQGPALLIGSDSQFTEEDISGIQQLGTGSKREDENKIGQFGYGFNSVYNLTDMPTFMTGRKLYMFDPLKKYVSQGQSKPGRAFRMDDQFTQQYQDQFSPYDIRLEDQPLYQGTLFRLPLRETASGISSKVISRNSLVNDIVKPFVDSLEENLIFLKNVKKVAVWHWKRYEEKPSMMTEVRCDREEIAVSQDRSMKRNMKVTKMTMKDEAHHYLVSTAELDVPPVMKKLQDTNKKMRGVGGVAIKIDQGADSIQDVIEVNGRMYVYLPLDESSRLPFHVHGSFAVQSNRSSLWCGDSHDYTEWNKWLLENVIVDALFRASLHLAPLRLHSYYKVLTPETTGGQGWKEIIMNGLCKKIAHTKDKWFPCSINGSPEMVTPAQLHLLILEIDERVKNALGREGICISDAPMYLQLRLHKENTTLKQLEPQVVRELYSMARTYRSLDGDNEETIKALFAYCMLDGAVQRKSSSVERDIKSMARQPSLRRYEEAEHVIEPYMWPLLRDCNLIHLNIHEIKAENVITAMKIIPDVSLSIDEIITLWKQEPNLQAREMVKDVSCVPTDGDPLVRPDYPFLLNMNQSKNVAAVLLECGFHMIHQELRGNSSPTGIPVTTVDRILRILSPDVTSLDSEQRDVLIGYLNNASTSVLPQVRRLAIHETIDGRPTSLDKLGVWHLPPEGAPAVHRTQSNILASNDIRKPLYLRLNIKPLSLLIFYRDSVLPNFKHMRKQERSGLLKGGQCLLFKEEELRCFNTSLDELFDESWHPFLKALGAHFELTDQNALMLCPLISQVNQVPDIQQLQPLSTAASGIKFVIVDDIENKSLEEVCFSPSSLVACDLSPMCNTQFQSLPRGTSPLDQLGHIGSTTNPLKLCYVLRHLITLLQKEELDVDLIQRVEQFASKQIENDESSEPELEELSQMKCILHNHDLFLPSQILLKDEESYPPHLISVPLESFRKMGYFLEAVGCHREISLNLLFQVLSSIYKASDDGKLIESSQQYVRKIYKDIERLLEDPSDHEIWGVRTEDSIDSSLHCQNLYVPTTDGYLVECEGVYFNDKPGYQVNSTLREADSSIVKESTARILELSFVSDTAREEMMKDTIRPENIVTDGRMSQCDLIVKKEEFHQAILSLCEMSRMRVDKTRLNELRELEYVHVRKIYTRLINQESGEEQSQVVDYNRSYFEETEKKIYLSGDHDTAVDSLVSFIMKHIDVNIDFVHIKSMIQCDPNTDDLSKLIERLLGVGAKRRPQIMLGDLIDEYEHHLLNNPLHKYHKGEFVAWQENSNYFLARIISVVAAEGEENTLLPAKTYCIQMGPLTSDKKEVNAFSLFRFTDEINREINSLVKFEGEILEDVKSEEKTEEEIKSEENRGTEGEKKQLTKEEKQKKAREVVDLVHSQVKGNYDEADRFLKRLHVEYHPDKAGDDPFYNHVTQYLIAVREHVKDNKPMATIEKLSNVYLGQYLRGEEETERQEKTDREQSNDHRYYEEPFEWKRYRFYQRGQQYGPKTHQRPYNHEQPKYENKRNANEEKARQWMAEAERELLLLPVLLNNDFFPACCFHSREAVYKAMKSLAYRSRMDCAVDKMMSLLDLNAALHLAIDDLQFLEEYFIKAREPSELGEPHRWITRENAERALQFANRIVNRMK